MNLAMSFSGLLTGFLVRARLMRAEEQVVTANDPQRDPNYCWTHNMIWPACAGMH